MVEGRSGQDLIGDGRISSDFTGSVSEGGCRAVVGRRCSAPCRPSAIGCRQVPAARSMEVHEFAAAYGCMSVQLYCVCLAWVHLRCEVKGFHAKACSTSAGQVTTTPLGAVFLVGGLAMGLCISL